MKINHIFIILIFYLLGILSSCDHGINPEEDDQNKYVPTGQSGIAGTIYYQNWPSADSLYNLKLVAFKNYPPENIVDSVLSGSAIAHPTELEEHLPYDEDVTTYTMMLDSGRYEYIVIAQQYGPQIYFNWWVIGQYDTTLQDSIPTAITVYQDSIIENINIYVNFDSVLFKP
jgi:hypothetical protein